MDWHWSTSTAIFKALFFSCATNRDKNNAKTSAIERKKYKCNIKSERKNIQTENAVFASIFKYTQFFIFWWDVNCVYW